MADKNLLQLPLATTGTGALLYGVQDNTDKAFPASVLTGDVAPQAANFVYAGPTAPPGALPSFRRLVLNDIPDLSALYMRTTGGSLVSPVITNPSITGGNISGATIVVDDDKFRVRNATDTTKVIRFNVAGITAGQTRIYSWPDASGEVVTTDAIQNLANKSMILRASGTAGATFRVPHGVAPTTPVDGDMWTTAGGLYVRISGVTVGPLAAEQASYVTSFNTRIGDVTLLPADITSALGYMPWDPATNLTTAANITAGAITGTSISDSAGNLRTGTGGINSKVAKAGDTMTGLLRVNADLKVQSGSNMLRFLNDSGDTAIQAVSAAESAFTTFKIRGQDVQLTGNTVNAYTSQLGAIGPTIGTGAFAGYILGLHEARPGSNADKIALQYYRSNGSTSTSWSDFTWRWGRVVDATQQQYLEFQPTGDIYFQCGTGTGGTVRFTAVGAVVASGGWGPGSDPKLKDSSSFRRLDNALEKVYNLNVTYGKYHDWYNADGKERVFLMADSAMKQSVPQAILNEAIEQDGNKYDGWSADQIIALCVKAIQELTDEVAILKEQINELSN